MFTRLQKLKTKLISASRISNSIKNDKIIDYLDLLNENGLYINENLNIINKNIQTKKRKRSDDDLDIDLTNKKKSSFDYIVENGYLFEYKIIDKIKELMKNNNELKELKELTETNIHINCINTINIIKENKHTIILGSVLINKYDNTWGKPDLIVKGSWINKYIQEKNNNLNINKWYIIDIKSSTILLINNGDNISTKILYSVYKSQIYIYTQALNNLLKDSLINNDVKFGFIMGSKYKFILNKNKIIKNSFERLAIFDFDFDKKKGIYWDKIIKSSVEWINELRSNWKDYSINPINKDELYPNMKNNYCKNWQNIKKNIAFSNKEISLLWYCNIINRDNVWNKGIKSYTDIKLTPELLGINNKDSKYIILNSMLKLLHEKKNYILDKKNNL
jgi:hypothetical protein